MTLLDEIKSGESRTLESAINTENGDKMEILIQKSFEEVYSISFNETKLCRMFCTNTNTATNNSPK